jgi:hypothetical protein
MRPGRRERSLHPMGRLATRDHLRGTGMAHRPGPALRTGGLLLALALNRRTATRASVVMGRAAYVLARDRLRRREARRRAARRRQIGRSIVVGSVVVAAAAAKSRRPAGAGAQ